MSLFSPDVMNIVILSGLILLSVFHLIIGVSVKARCVLMGHKISLHGDVGKRRVRCECGKVTLPHIDVGNGWNK